MVLWTVDTEDWRLPGSDSIVNAVVGGAKPGAIFLMHDAGGDRAETIAALPKIITDLRARGYKLVTVPPADPRQPAAGESGHRGDERRRGRLSRAAPERGWGAG